MRGDVAGLMVEYGRVEPVYAWHRLVDIILVSLPRLAILDSDDRVRRAQFAEKMGWMFALGAATVSREDCGVCVDPVLFLGHRLDDGAHAVALPLRAVGDYERWRLAAESFERLLLDSAAMGAPDALGPLGRILDHTLGHRRHGSLADDLERHLLASHLRGRAVTTPYDIANSPSFVDVGVLDLAAMVPPAVATRAARACVRRSRTADPLTDG